MSLKDEAHLATKVDQLPSASSMQILPKDREFAVLDPSEGSDKGQECRFSRTTWSGHNDNLAREYGQVIIEQDLFSELTRSEEMLKIQGPNRRIDILSHSNSSAWVEKCRSLHASRQHRIDILRLISKNMMCRLLPRLLCSVIYSRIDSQLSCCFLLPNVRSLPIPRMMMTHRFALPSISKRARSFYCLVILAIIFQVGCSPSRLATTAPTALPRDVGFDTKTKSNQVLAQGRIQPAKGLIRLSAIPGDRVEQVLVQAGQNIRKQQPLIVLQSQQLRALELEAASLRLDEARALRQVKQQEAELAIDASGLKLQSAMQMVTQANSQLALAKKGGEQVESLGRQISTLQKLRESPLTRAAIGTIELETKKNELNKISSVSEQGLLVAQQAVEIAKLQLVQSERSLVAAKESRELVDQATPIASLEKQIDILKLQLAQSNLVSPLDGVVISVNVEEGERTAQLPLFELADLSEMVCLAEVHESDVASIAIDDLAEIRSSALGRTLKGQVFRIDRVVGAAQMRSPNPMARSDFRSIPVWIKIEANDIEMASQRLQLQVDVSINKTR